MLWILRKAERIAFKAKGIEILVYEPELNEPDFFNPRVERDLTVFTESVAIILANWMDVELEYVSRKVFTRDLFGAN